MRCIFNKNPFVFLFSFFFIALIFFSINIRIFERPFASIRNSNYNNHKTQIDFNQYANSIWFVFMTILPVGYGDIYPKTIMGRLYTFLAILSGLLIVSLTTVAFFQYFELSTNESKIYLLLKRMKLREVFKQLQQKIVQEMMLHHYLKYKIRIAKENLEENSEFINDKELIQVENQIKKWHKNKSNSELKLSHLIKAKNKIHK
jgi:magnesium-transporting ATPase (P-type)